MTGNSGSAVEGELIDLKNGVIRDTALKVDWMKNANLAFTETFGVKGIWSSGQMSWHVAQEWIAAMNAASYLGYSDWRLPRALPSNGASYNLAFARDGSSDFGFNIVTPNSEMMYVYHAHLGNKGYWDTSNNYQEGWGLSNIAPFENLFPSNYWTGTEVPPDLSQGHLCNLGNAEKPLKPTHAFDNFVGNGGQDFSDKGFAFFIWPVRSHEA